MTVFSVSSTVARARMIHTNDPDIPIVAARRSLASMSHRMYPGNQVDMLSVGHMRALTKLHRLAKTVQEIRLQAATLWFLRCQTRGGTSRRIAMSDKVGNTMDAGVKLSAGEAIIRYAG